MSLPPLSHLLYITDYSTALSSVEVDVAPLPIQYTSSILCDF